MSQRELNKKSALHTMAILNQGFYQINKHKTVDISLLLQQCKENTELYTPEELVTTTPFPPHVRRQTTIEVVGETTLHAAKRSVGAKEKTVVLNFASARNPGGQFLKGSSAQEESLARSSGLYPSLLTKPIFYSHHNNNRDPLYSHHMIYSPSVPVIKNDMGNLLESPYNVSVITSAAVNKGVYIERNPRAQLSIVHETMKNRIRHLLSIASSKGYETLILGAFGCGVFKNNPIDVARYFKEVLAEEDYSHAFKRIIFAIYDKSPQKESLNAFKQAFPISKK